MNSLLHRNHFLLVDAFSRLFRSVFSAAGRTGIGMYSLFHKLPDLFKSCQSPFFEVPGVRFPLLVPSRAVPPIFLDFDSNFP